MISSSSDGRVRRAIASKFIDLGIISSPVKPKTQKLVITAFLPYTLSVKETVLVMTVMTSFKTQPLENFEQDLVSVLVLAFQEKTVWVQV